jgi:uncharacterized protein (DUF2141 family)
MRTLLAVVVAFSISGRVTGHSGKHSVRIALWNDREFLVKPVQERLVAAGQDPAFRFEVDAGRWALSAYEDENESGALEQGVFGPIEPHGFSVPFKKWRKPTFEDVAFEVSGDLADAGISLR